MNAEHIATIREALELARHDVIMRYNKIVGADARLSRLSDALAALDTPAPQWEPLPDGTYHTDGPEIITVEGARLTVYQGARGVWANVPMGMAFCRAAQE